MQLFQITKIDEKRGPGTESPQCLAIFENLLLKIQPKNLKLVHHQFLSVRGNISLGGGLPGPTSWLRPCILITFFKLQQQAKINMYIFGAFTNSTPFGPH